MPSRSWGVAANPPVNLRNLFGNHLATIRGDVEECIETGQPFDSPLLSGIGVTPIPRPLPPLGVDTAAS